MVEPLPLRPTVSAIAEGFRTRFEIVPALSEALKDAAYRLRHSVYCEDLGFEALRSDRREVDEYDDHATALLIRRITSDEYIGCARLIRPKCDALEDLLPFERTCAHTLNRELIDAELVPRERIAEISRLAVISKFRRRKGEASVPAALAENDFGNGPTPRFPYILLGLYLGIVALADLQGVERLFFLTEPRLAKHLTTVGFDLVQAGGPVEHRGTRILSMLSVPRVISGLNRHLRPIYQVVQSQMSDAIASCNETSVRRTGVEAVR